MGLFHKSEAYLGVDIGAGGIKLVELHKTKGRAQLWTYGIIEEPLDIHIDKHEKTPEEILAESRQEEDFSTRAKKHKDIPADIKDPRIEHFASLLKELSKTAKVTTNRATASLPVSYIFHTVLTLPHIDEKKLNAVISAEIEKMLPRPVNEMQVVHQKIPALADNKEKDGKYVQYLVTAAPKDLVAFYTAIFQKAGLQLEELETEAFALERSLVGRDTATAMVVDMGSERTNFFIMSQGLPVTQRSIQIGGNSIDAVFGRVLGIEQEDVGQVKLDASRLNASEFDIELFNSIVDPIIKEIEYGFDLYLKQTGNEGKRPEKIILTGGSSLFPPIADKIKNFFDLKVFVGDPWARVVYQQGLKPALNEIGPRMAVCIGLAMRNIGYKN
ncbi:MAG: pilus assembly protein PilM [Patescibacteria group bacterium]